MKSSAVMRVCKYACVCVCVCVSNTTSVITCTVKNCLTVKHDRECSVRGISVRDIMRSIHTCKRTIPLYLTLCECVCVYVCVCVCM